MTSDEVTTAIRSGRTRSDRRGLDRLQSLLDALDGRRGAHRRGLIPGGDARGGGEDIRVAHDVLGHLIVWIAELRGNLSPREVCQVARRVAGAVEAEHAADVEEWELARLGAVWSRVVLGEDVRDLRGHRVEFLLVSVLDLVRAEVDVRARVCRFVERERVGVGEDVGGGG